MLNNAQIKRMLGKLVRLEKTLEPYVFTAIGDIKVKRYQTPQQHHSVPQDESLYIDTSRGDAWGGEGVYCWFRGKTRIPAQYAGKTVFINPKVGGYEGLLWVDGVPRGIFANNILNTSQGNHSCDMLAKEADPEKEIDVAIEFYAGHYILGTQPLKTDFNSDFKFTFDAVNLCIKNNDIADFIFDLRTLNQMAEKLDPLSFRRADVVNCLIEVHRTVYYAVEDAEEQVWRPALAKARERMRKTLAVKNSESAPIAGLTGHSHMDTAWLWHIPETLKKCARAYANQVSLMDQYPEYRFIQSSAFHGEMIRRNYPQLFENIAEKVAEGRYEPNGGVWVECDCNITSGESMIRQFVWGQRFTRKYFGYTSNCFWLPDTFGYSGAIPQIMKGCGVDYFLTTKLSWNDTNKFPYETFYWEGVDGTRVFAHFNTSHTWPDPKALLEQLEGRGHENCLQNKTVSKRRLVAYGFGDGGGGPQYEMIEMAKRVKDLDGCPRAEHTSVGRFMEELEAEAVDAPVYKGELYFELHRGTLTSQHAIKHNNRKAEIALHNLEYLTVRQAVSEGAPAGDLHIRPLLETVLVNQFHDILPGTSISRVNDQSYREMGEVLERLQAHVDKAIDTKDEGHAFTVYNTLGFDREETVYIDGCAGLVPADGKLRAQRVEDLHGKQRLCVAGVRLPSLGGTVLKFKEGSPDDAVGQPAFIYEGNVLTTPFARVTFEEDGTIGSFVDTRVNRELRGAGLPLNTFLMAEDVPLAFDNWDIDADCQMKFEPCVRLIERRVVSTGSVQFRIRSVYELSGKSTLTQDMIFYSTTAQVDFETIIDWKEKHRFLKVGFNTTVMSRTARHEIQFGNLQRPTSRNNSIEQAMFEVVNHKYTDLSETRYGVAILNDCKYGISVEDSDIRLSLHKGGTRPDPRGDEGVHECVYSFLPHVGGFSAENVILPAYSLNYKPIVKLGAGDCKAFARVDSANIVIETIKPCEDNQKAFILRLYEAEGTFTNAVLTLGIAPRAVEITNLLEETTGMLPPAAAAGLSFRPFEIKTLKISY